MCTYVHVGAVCVHSKVEACTPTCMGAHGCAQAQVCKTLRASPQHSLVSPLFAQLSDSLISRDFQDPQQQRDSHFLGTIEAKETWSPDSNCNFNLPLPHFLRSSLEDPVIIPQRCTKDEMHLRTSCQQKGCQQRMGQEQGGTQKGSFSGEWES